jgi:hypothetical protein
VIPTKTFYLTFYLAYILARLSGGEKEERTTLMAFGFHQSRPLLLFLLAFYLVNLLTIFLAFYLISLRKFFVVEVRQGPL